ncbi:MAG: DUF4430 domain-containing protein [Candidatus Ranarchaeia archaeon]
MSINNKPWLITGIVIIWAIISSGLSASFFVQYNTLIVDYSNIQTEYEELTEGQIFVDIGFNYGNGTIQWTNNTMVPSNTTVWALTQISVSSYNFTQYSFGPYVTMLNGHENNATHFWLYYVNDVFAMISSSDYLLTPGDSVIWSYESF